MPLTPTSPKNFRDIFDTVATKITKATGSPYTVIGALAVVFIWAASGNFFNYSENWQLLINTCTTIITFIMVFIIQHAQNKDTIAIHLKLNELLAVNKDASNRVVNIEDLSESELSVLKKFYEKLSDLAKKEKDIFATHSIDEALQNHEEK